MPDPSACDPVLHDPLVHTLLRSSADAVWILDAKGRLCTANEAAFLRCPLLRPQDALGQPLAALLPVLASPPRQAALQQALDTGESQVFEEVLEHSAMEFHVHRTQGREPPLLVVVGKDLSRLHTAMEHVRREQQRFQYLLESLEGPVLLVGQDLTVRYCNRICRRLLGNLVGSHCEHVACMQGAEALLPFRRNLTRPASWEWQHQARHFHMTSAPMTDADGETVCIIHGVDITRRKEAELQLAHSQQQLAAIVSYAQEGIVVLSDGKLVFANPYMLLLVGQPPEMLTGQSFVPFIHPDDQPRVLDIHANRLAGREVPFSYDCRLVHPAHGAKWVQVAAALLEWEGRPAVLAMLTDISERKKMEHMLQNLLQEQDHIIHEKTNSLVEANRQLEQANHSLRQSMEEQHRTAKKLEVASRKALAATRTKSRFLANMGHEIRTPLNVILGMAQVALRDTPANSPRRPLEMILESGEHLLAIINDLLDFSKIEAHQLVVEHIPMDLHALVRRTVEGFSPAAADKGLVLTLHIHDAVPQVVMGDPARITQVLNNLLSNAVKFTSQGRIAVSLRRLRPRARAAASNVPTAALLWCVQDTGPGIPDDKIISVFRSFQQADASVARRYGGTGLGLTISRRLARLMGGEVWVRSKEGLGSRFFFSARLDAPDACLLGNHHLRHPAPSPGCTAPRTILLAEDSPQNTEMLLALLAPYGHRIVHAADGQAALEALRHPEVHGVARFDVVLMDVQMPVLDGLEATRILRSGEDPALPWDIPVIALTAHTMEQEVHAILQAGATRHLAKPVDVRQLVQTLADVTPGVTPGDVQDVAPTLATDMGMGMAWQSEREAALARLGGSTALLAKLTEIFRRQTPNHLEAARAAWQQHDLAALAEQAHALKGNAAAIGAQWASDTAAQVEAAARQARADLLPPLLQTLETAVNASLQGIAQQQAAR